MPTSNIALTAALCLALAACAAPAPGTTPPVDTPAAPSADHTPATPAPATPSTPTPQPATTAPDTPPPATETPAPAPTDAEGATVSIIDFAFQPAGLNIDTGTSVTWTNDGDFPHTVTFEGGPASGTISAGATFEHTFDAAGTFAYICSFHPSMTGTINVSD